MRRRGRGGEMPSQLRLDFGEPAPPWPVREALFFAVLPEGETAHDLVEVGRRLCRRFGVRGAVQPAARLHVTLLGFRVEESALGAGIAIARRIGDAVRAPSFAAVFEGAMSFGSQDRPALVLRCGQGGEAGLAGLRDRLRDAIDDLGVTREGVDEGFAPHLTLVYDSGRIPEVALDAPIPLIARELVLIRSEQGLGRHTHLGRWPLRAA